MDIVIREATLEDSQACGRILYHAFKNINQKHGFNNQEVPSEDSGNKMANFFIKHHNFFGRVAEYKGQISGVIFIDERNPKLIGLNIMAVSDEVQGKGIGRSLLQLVIDRCKKAPGARFLQHTFNTHALGLYTSLGFDVREPIVLIDGKPKSQVQSGVEVRRMEYKDLDSCSKLCEKVYGFSREEELKDAMYLFKPYVAVQSGVVKAYLSATDNWAQNHGVAENENDMQLLIIGIASDIPQQLSFLVPLRKSDFLRWCLNEGFRIVKPFTLMSMHEYIKPTGLYFTSINY